jgi:predicted transcriptional regulator
VDASQDVLIDIFVRIESFFKRLESYTEVPPTAAMTDVIVKIMIEVLSILAIATKEIKQGRSSALIYVYLLLLTYSFLEKFVKKLLGRNDIEDALKRLDTLTTEEARMAIAETLNVTHKVDDKVTVLIEGGRDTFYVIQPF